MALGIALSADISYIKDIPKQGESPMTTQQIEGGYQLTLHGDRVATACHPHRPGTDIAYFGFGSEAAARHFWAYVTGLGVRAQVRSAKHLRRNTFEVKVWRCPQCLIDRCIEIEDAARNYAAACDREAVMVA